MIDEFYYKLEKYATCPYCGAKEYDSWELEDEQEIECDCGGTYLVVREVEVKYSSAPKSAPEK